MAGLQVGQAQRLQFVEGERDLLELADGDAAGLK
jgi:hypothetical protein